jgi:hypothetical protein
VTTPKTIAERDALQRHIAEIGRQIEVEQRAPVDPAVMAAAIEQARRDQDALTSPVLEDLRETAEKLAEDIEYAWIGLCRTMIMADALADHAPTLTVPPALVAALDAAAAARPQLIDQLRDAGIDNADLPELPPYPHVLRETNHGPR